MPDDIDPDYGSMPVGEFGLAFLRGCGWKNESSAIGRTNARAVPLPRIKPRPKVFLLNISFVSFFQFKIMIKFFIFRVWVLALLFLQSLLKLMTRLTINRQKLERTLLKHFAKMHSSCVQVALSFKI